MKYLVAEEHLLQETIGSGNFDSPASIESVKFQLRRHLESCHLKISSCTSTCTTTTEMNNQLVEILSVVIGTYPGFLRDKT